VLIVSPSIDGIGILIQRNPIVQTHFALSIVRLLLSIWVYSLYMALTKR